MVVECNKCHTKLKMDPAKVGPMGVRVRCSKCQTIFRVDPPQAPVATPPPPPAIPLELVIPKPITTAPVPAPVPEKKKEEENPFIQDNPFLNVAPVASYTPPPPPPKSDSVQAPENNPLDMESLLAPVAQPVQSNFSPQKMPQKISSSQSSLKSKSSSGISTPGLTPKTNRLTRAQPLAAQNFTIKQRLIHALIVLFVFFGGSILGLTAMGIKPTFSGLSLLMKYGAKQIKPGVNLLQYHGKIVDLTPAQRKLLVSGVLYNAQDQSQKPPKLLLKVLSPAGEYIAQKTDKCCEADLNPFEPSSFQMELDLPPSVVGGFQISIQD